MRILIVGGGIAGLSLAKALEQRGIVADLVERQSARQAGGAGLYLPGNATRALGQLGLLPEVSRKAFPIERQRILDSRGRLLNSIETGDVWRACGSCLALPRNDMQAILQGALKRTSINFSKSVGDIRQSAAACEVTFEDGSVGKYHLVVGADGINSAVRRIAFPDTAPRYVGNLCWRFIIPNNTGIDCWTAMLGDGRTLLAIPVGRSDVYVYADLAVDGGATGSFSHRSILPSLFAGFGPPVFPLIERVPPDTTIHFGRIEQVRIPDWTKGRVVVIGDAAHASSPSMAEGAGMAMEDALVLADALAEEDGIDKALQAYTLRRRPRVEWVQSQSMTRDKMRSLPRLARHVILKHFGSAIYKRSYAPLLRPIS